MAAHQMKGDVKDMKEFSAVGGLSPLSETLWKGKTDTSCIGDVSARLTWKDLFVEVPHSSKENHVLLNGLTGYAEPGSVMAIMGPSGSGKTTLLDTLAGRLPKNTAQSGEILLNGRRLLTLSYGTAAYVTQQDDLIGTLTVRETVYYSAALRLPDRMPRKERREIVESTIRQMGLVDCANTHIGNWHLRGLSGGEKRRLSIALEILTRPRLLFLDEPTSGLDSAAAFFVTTTLKQLAQDGRTVIASIHQPSSDVFELFDSLCLLSNGNQIYFGEGPSAREFFASAGFPCPSLRNPSDHYLRAINADFDTVRSSIMSSKRMKDVESGNPLDHITTQEVVAILIEQFRDSEYAMRALERVQEISHTKGNILESSGSEASFLKQSFVLTRRSFVNMYRDIGYYWLRLVIYIMLTLCIATIYFKIGNSFNSILARAGCMSYVGGFLTFMSIGGFPSFVEDMKVFHRERLNGHYGVTSFVIGNFISSLPYLFVIAVVSAVIVYFMVDLHPGFVHFLYFVLILFACVACVESLMMAVASVVPNFLMGIITGAGIQGIFMLVAGYFRLPNDLPKPIWRYPMSYLSFDYYALEGMYENDFLGLTFKNVIINGVMAQPEDIPGEYILQNTYQIDLKRNKWENLLVVFGMVLGYRLIFFIMIKIKEDLRPVIRYLVARYSTKFKANRKMSTVQMNTVRPVPKSPSPKYVIGKSRLSSQGD